MAEPERILPITFELGLLESQEDPTTPLGFARQLENWVPEPGGGLRVRPAWLKGSTTGAPAAPRKCRSIGHLARTTQPATTQSATANGVTVAGNVTLAPSWPQATQTGSLLLLFVGIGEGSPTITPPAGWVQDVTISAGVNRTARIYSKTNAASESGAVSVAITAAGTDNAAAVEIREYIGVSVTSPLDVTASNSGTSATPGSGTTAATARAVEIAVALLLDTRVEAQTAPTNSFTELSEQQVSAATGPITMSVYHKATTATGTQNVSATTATSDTWVGVIATYKGWYASASPPVTAGYFLGVHQGATTSDIYSIDRDSLSAGTWSLVESVTAVDPAQPVAFAPGLGAVYYVSTQFSTGRKWDGEVAASVAAMPPGRAIAFHKNRLFVGGNPAYPSRLYYSALGDGSSWPSTNFIDVGRDDGEPIEDIAPFADGLLIGKQTRLYFLSGSGPDTFDLDGINGGSCAPGRSIMPTPYGAIIAGRKHVWIWLGSAPELISKPIETTYGYSGTHMSIAYLDGQAFICDEGSGEVHVFDLLLGKWRTDPVGGAAQTAERPAVVYNQDEKLLMGPRSGTEGSLINYKLMPGTARAKDYDALQEVFSAHTPQIWPFPEGKVTPRHLYLTVLQRGGGVGDTGLSVTPSYDNGPDETATVVAAQASAPKVFRTRIDLGNKQGVDTVKVKLSQTLPSAQASSFDILECLLGFDAEEIR